MHPLTVGWIDKRLVAAAVPAPGFVSGVIAPLKGHGPGVVVPGSDDDFELEPQPAVSAARTTSAIPNARKRGVCMAQSWPRRRRFARMRVVPNAVPLIAACTSTGATTLLVRTLSRPNTAPAAAVARTMPVTEPTMRFGSFAISSPAGCVRIDSIVGAMCHRPNTADDNASAVHCE